MRLASTYITGLWTLYVTTLHRGDGEHGRRSDWQDAGAALPRDQACIPSTDCCAESATSVPYREELSDSYRSVQLTLRGKPALR